MFRAKSFCIAEQTMDAKIRNIAQHISKEKSLSKIQALVKELFPKLGEEQIKLFSNQIKLSQCHSPLGYRWDSDILKLALTLWVTSPKCYQEIVKSKSLVLPTTSLLSLYKNSVEQKTGINHNVFHWLDLECSQQKTPMAKCGGLVLDEMSIQEKITCVGTKSRTQFIGFVDVGYEANLVQPDKCSKLASHILQYMYVGLNGFRFPVAQYSTATANTLEIEETFWEVIGELAKWNFSIFYSVMDGASYNRKFIKQCFLGEDPISQSMSAYNMFGNQNIIFLSDPSHVLKKIRNSIRSSTIQDTATRNLLKNNESILWSMWGNAFQWDYQCFPRTYRNLTHLHVFLSKSPDLMRNFLAVEVLDCNMLDLMRKYQNTLANPSDVQGAVSLLEMTSKLVNFVYHHGRIDSMRHPLVSDLIQVKNFFLDWQCEAMANKKAMLTEETMEDVQFYIVGVLELFRVCINFGYELSPANINSDILENIFSQQRGIYHGNNTNPSVHQYSYGINSVIIGQKSISNKSNAYKRTCAKSTAISQPYKRLRKDAL